MDTLKIKEGADLGAAAKAAEAARRAKTPPRTMADFSDAEIEEMASGGNLAAVAERKKRATKKP